MEPLKHDRRYRISLTLDGRRVEGEAEPRMLLSDFLREEIGTTGVHVGCEHGVCGACTVEIDGKAVRSCLTLAVQAEGRRIDTVAALADDEGRLSTLQEAFRRHHALQCGYCTPGVLVSLNAFLRTNPRPSEAEIRTALGGNLCRCTGYVGMVRAVLEVTGQSG